MPGYTQNKWDTNSAGQKTVPYLSGKRKGLVLFTSAPRRTSRLWAWPHQQPSLQHKSDIDHEISLLVTTFKYYKTFILLCIIAQNVTSTSLNKYTHPFAPSNSRLHSNTHTYSHSHSHSLHKSHHIKSVLPLTLRHVKQSGYSLLKLNWPKKKKQWNY